MALNFLAGFFSKDLGIDLGTANTVVYVRGKGVVVFEPSMVAIRKSDKKVIAVGEEAKKMLGRTPEEFVTIRPLRDGVIADFDAAEKMIRYFIEKVHNKRDFLISPRMVIGIPSGTTPVERRAVFDTAYSVGARDVLLVTEPIASALGADLPIWEPSGNIIVDVGGGTTEIAVISLGGIVVSTSIKVAGDEMDEAIMHYIRKKYNLYIGERTAEDIKISIGNVSLGEEKKEYMEVRGRDLLTGVPRNVELSSEEVREALKDTVDIIVEAIRNTLEKTPPELAADIMDKGIVLCGGGSLLKGLDQYISEEIGVVTIVAENPLLCVVKGTGKIIEEFDKYKQILPKPVEGY
ncbi:MAG TPA: rod shape-determining protein [Dictyoglomaceae bacterium]|nr:rod shape-determining protein [Dictyoglomaceae bacterium]HOL39634.1 rod shape-determining protein [Dictyoglomaceae bacterium]HPP15206.1 rod shape-determining protein [Dictyoglomaceae bacterium]HPU42612.1 rod shape-determining protein [Dictyoglomaceae bacterium]